MPHSQNGNNERRRVHLRISESVRNNLSVNADTDLSHVILRTFIDRRACLAFIMQESLNALDSGKGLLSCLFAAYLAYQQIENGQITREDVQERHCTCVTEEDRAFSEHYCMSCFTLRPCNQMGRRISDVGTLVECSACLELSGTGRIFLPQTVQGILHVRVLTIFRKDRRILGQMPFTREELEKALLQNHTIDDPKLWKDGYSDKLVSIEDAKNSREIMSSGIRLKRPFSMSLEKPHSRWLREDGSMSLHDPENCTLTKTCINLCKASFPPAILPQLKRAIELRQQVQYQKPCRGYHAEVEQTWKALEVVCTHRSLHMLLY
jgi:hypothetical protein